MEASGAKPSLYNQSMTKREYSPMPGTHTTFMAASYSPERQHYRQDGERDAEDKVNGNDKGKQFLLIEEEQEQEGVSHSASGIQDDTFVQYQKRQQHLQQHLQRKHKQGSGGGAIEMAANDVQEADLRQLQSGNMQRYMKEVKR